jgi:LytS/YehU family sensor histidine kinase
MCTVLVAILLFIQLKYIRDIFNGSETRLKDRLKMALFFGFLGIIGTQNSVIVDISNYKLESLWVKPFEFLHDNTKAHIGFRDTMAMAAGLFGGPWVGLLAGFISGVERFTLGGMATHLSGIASMVLGLVAGLAMKFYPASTRQGSLIKPMSTVVVVLVGTMIQRIIVLYDNPLGLEMAFEIGVPVAIVNVTGCLLFFLVMSKLEQDRREQESEFKRQEAESRANKEIKDRKKAELTEKETKLRWLNSQVTSHTYCKPLDNMQYLIGLGIDDNDYEALDLVYDACGKVAKYLRNTLTRCTDNEAITLKQDYQQLDEYRDLTNLKYYKNPKPFYDFGDIPPELLDCLIPPATLLTLAENALVHGNKDNRDGFLLQIIFNDLGDSFIVRVKDNGCGILPDRLAKLGKHQVKSTIRWGGGTGLYRLVQSLELYFSGLAQWSISSPDRNGTEVVLTLPKRWRRKVIIIDEENLFQEDFEFILRSQYRDFSIVGNEINDEIWKLLEQGEIDGVFIGIKPTSINVNVKTNLVERIKAVNNPPWVVFVTDDVHRISDNIRQDELLNLPLGNTEVENLLNAIRNKYQPKGVFKTK